MSNTKRKFGAMADTSPQAEPTPKPTPSAKLASPSNDQPTATQANRIGKKAISGYFSPQMSQAMRMLAIKNGKTLNEQMAEAFDLVLRQYGETPIGG